MSEAQRIIKYLALAFAFFLVFSIISAIMYSVVSLSNVFDNGTNSKKEVIKLSNNAQVLDINLDSTNLVIKTGEKLTVKANEKYIDVEKDRNKLSINEKTHSWFNTEDRESVIVYIPSNFTFNLVSIDNAAGKIKIEELYTEKLKMNLDAGKTDAKDIIVLNEAKINSGAGKLTIDKSNINNLNLDMGVGKVTLTSNITGKSKIEAGIGKMNLNLIGSISDYKIKTDNGMGNVTINGNIVENDSSYGNGENILDISGGIGNIKISFIK